LNNTPSGGAARYTVPTAKKIRRDLKRAIGTPKGHAEQTYTKERFSINPSLSILIGRDGQEADRGTEVNPQTGVSGKLNGGGQQVNGCIN